MPLINLLFHTESNYLYIFELIQYLPVHDIFNYINIIQQLLQSIDEMQIIKI